ncbi:hypothetical protein CHARACLAT_026441 [Characodon lateralis]|uniref:Uncharacterized protein n=1 Tax=Characodon lateralis TaxID=208331 RepID=A0ABU7EQQ4_9TELE|nr:hypothetical protein [Characodon lateralis]
MLTHTAHSLLLFDSDGHIRQPAPWQPQGLNSSVKSLGAHTQTHILPPPPLHTHMHPPFASNCWIPLQHTNRLEENTQRRRKRSEKKREVKCSETQTEFCFWGISNHNLIWAPERDRGGEENPFLETPLRLRKKASHAPTHRGKTACTARPQVISSWWTSTDKGLREKSAWVPGEHPEELELRKRLAFNLILFIFLCEEGHSPEDPVRAEPT